MDKRDKEILIETLEYFLNGLKDVETSTHEQQPKIYELEYIIPLVKKLNIDDVSNLLGENTVSVSNDSDESSVLHGVGESHASEPTDKDSQSFDDGTLEIITEAKEVYCNSCYRSIKPFTCYYEKCADYFEKKPIDS